MGWASFFADCARKAARARISFVAASSAAVTVIATPPGASSIFVAALATELGQCAMFPAGATAAGGVAGATGAGATAVLAGSGAGAGSSVFGLLHAVARARRRTAENALRPLQ